ARPASGLRRLARTARAARADFPVPPQRHRRGQCGRPPQAAGDGARGGGGGDEGQARLRALGADLLRRVRRAAEEARSRQGDWRMSTSVRFATRADLPRLWELLWGLATYERWTEYVTGTPEKL